MLFLLILYCTFFFVGIPTGKILTKIKGIDIEKIGSGNTGATNIYRALGLGRGIFVMTVDIIKGALPTMLAFHLFDDIWRILLISTVTILGNVFSPYLGYKGGKGIATGLGILSAHCPICAIILFIGGIMAIRLFKIVSVISFTAVAIVAIIFGYLYGTYGIMFGIFILSITLFAHRKNIKRLIKGKENKLKI